MEQQAQMKERELMMEAHLKEGTAEVPSGADQSAFSVQFPECRCTACDDGMRTRQVYFWKKMADFFRYNVRKMEEDAMLWEEIEAVDNYIYILNVRFAGDIVYIREIDEDIENIRIPSMILQPLVENAVQHGIHDCMETGRIVMSIHRNQDMIDITVSDNGAGMTEEMIAKVMEGRAVQDEENRYSTGIAVHNVIERLKLYYKQEGLMTIESDGPGTGTKVHIVIPMEKEELE